MDRNVAFFSRQVFPLTFKMVKLLTGHKKNVASSNITFLIKNPKLSMLH